MAIEIPNLSLSVDAVPALGPATEDDPLWYKDAIIYEAHVKSFFDSNKDGVGDFQGLTEKLEYLQGLGVTCIWLLPFFPSPLRDDRYHIADYRNVHPQYGTLEDFKAFVRAAHERNIKVLIELVVNHTSDQHPWFQRARHAPPGSPEREFYVWSDTDKKFPETRIIFTDTEKSNWTYDPVAKQYYWHRFFSHQPDLNHNNPAVVDAVIGVMKVWLELGVDALRLDAVPYLCVREGTNNENLPESHDVLKRMRRELDQAYRNRMLLAEANQWPSDVRAYFGDGDECHMAFHFPLMPRMFMALRQEDRHAITEILNQTPDIPENCQWALFLRNHDELTLEMVTDEERDYMYSAYASDPQMRLNVGIRRRLAPLVENSRRRVELLNTMLFSFPGTPIVYYGDELGMGDNIDLGDRNGVRTPMQWSSDRNAGFSRADPARLYAPPIQDPVYGYQSINVEAQERYPFSPLNWNKRLIAMRKQHRVFGRGTIEFVPCANRKILGYLRRDEKETILIVVNRSRTVQPAQLDLKPFTGLLPVEMSGLTEFPRISETPYFLTLGPYAYYWFTLQHEPVQKTAKAAAPIDPNAALVDGDTAAHLVKTTPAAVLARITGARKGAIVDGLMDDDACSRILALVERGDEVATRRGSVQGTRVGNPTALLAGPAQEHKWTRGGADQSNSVAFVNDKSVLKLFRRIEPAANPEFEIGRFLTTRQFTRIPALIGALEYLRPGFEPGTLAVVQSSVKHQGSGWDFTIDELRRYYERVAAREGPERREGVEPREGLDAPPPLFVALAGLLARFDDIRRLRHAGTRIRVHGDYHLGQVLRTEEDFVILDFEGEPARSIAERRAKQSPLKDVAGMVRSFGYAAYAALFAFTVHAPDEYAPLAPWADTWEHWATDAFLKGYAAAAGDSPLLPRDRGERDALLTAFTLDKALYELGYELNNRPDWVRIPLVGIQKLTESPGAKTAKDVRW